MILEFLRKNFDMLVGLCVGLLMASFFPFIGLWVPLAVIVGSGLYYVWELRKDHETPKE